MGIRKVNNILLCRTTVATPHPFITHKVSIYCVFASGATEGARAKNLKEITPVFDEFTQQGKLSACYCLQQ